MQRLDDNTLHQIAQLICGNDTDYYRRGHDIEKFFADAGWNAPPQWDGETRFTWTLNQLRERSSDSEAIESVIRRLCDPREYLGEPHTTAAGITQALNAVLVHEGYKVERPGGRPRIVECDPTLGAPGSLAPVTLKVTMDQVVSNPGLARVLQGRLNEAQTCSDNGCSIAAIIMLGSILEGVLLEAAMTRPTQRRQPLKQLSLHQLIELAHRHGWVGVDVVKYCHTLREYRNLVHPHAQIRMGDAPDRDTLNISWPVVYATLNDLAASKPAQGGLARTSRQD
ncbi:hypothetical protein ACGFNU_47570 [Spirillospora sp. NPDC048911]|uniref:hypothetical protein n=1 Tax=Spirillospora sp. NPDC048911 TaxID=3364527 RepID=UPI0037223099